MQNWKNLKKEIKSLSETEKKIFEIKVDIASKIIIKRTELNMSTKDLAEKLNLKENIIIKLENGEKFPNLETLILILSELNLNLEIKQKESDKLC